MQVQLNAVWPHMHIFSQFGFKYFKLTGIDDISGNNHINPMASNVYPDMSNLQPKYDMHEINHYFDPVRHRLCFQLLPVWWDLNVIDDKLKMLYFSATQLHITYKYQQKV